MTATSTGVGRYLWLDIEVPQCPQLAFLTNSIPSDITARETWQVRVEDSGARVHVGGKSIAARDAVHVGEIAYGALHDRVLWHARENGWFRLHMALVDVAGRRVALVGRSGSGKSTTALALAVRGAKIHGDDVAFLRAGQVIALPRPLHLREGESTRLAGAAWPLAHRLDYAPPVFVLDPAVAGLAPTRNTVAPIDLIVVVDPAPQASATTSAASSAASSATARALVELMGDAGAFNPRHGDLVREVSAVLACTPIVVMARRDPTDMARAIEERVGR